MVFRPAQGRGQEAPCQSGSYVTSLQYTCLSYQRVFLTSQPRTEPGLIYIHLIFTHMTLLQYGGELGV